ncbi:MAG: phosphatidate cytidylyltransferase [Treponema sp.]|jgi:phosphatidate cytidylyltransferase|nr:phosphatidate cytidylyltransferase [Treponema sp.]
MRKIIERLLIFCIGIPAVYALVFLLPFYMHLALNITVIVFSAIGALEFSFMLEKKNIKISKIEAVILGMLAPLAVLITVSFNKPGLVIGIIILLGIFWALLSAIFSKKENINAIINRFSGCISIIVYPGFFMSWIVLMSKWNSSAAIFLFLLIVFFNDSAAWLFGTLFGKNNRGIIPVSPNKSIAGFIGGLTGSVLVAFGAFYLFPNVFPFSSSAVFSLPAAGIILGFLTGLFATLGDLAESAIKRSCDFKDSGNLMLGRGGILDSIDSIAVAAPVYYLLFSLFFPG